MHETQGKRPKDVANLTSTASDRMQCNSEFGNIKGEYLPIDRYIVDYFLPNVNNLPAMPFFSRWRNGTALRSGRRVSSSPLRSHANVAGRGVDIIIFSRVLYYPLCIVWY